MPLGGDEVALARAAAAGDGRAFAALYDAYESRIFTFCHRIVGSPEDAADATQDAFVKVLQRLPKLSERELNFGAYLFTAARNASYDVLGRRRKADPVEEIPEHGARPVTGDGATDIAMDPERAALLGSLQDSVRSANAQLPERQREVLVLREVEELSYDEIAEIMDMNRNSVAQLISRARIKLRDELRGSALASVAVSSPDCERALPLIAMRQDGQLADDDERAWLAAHLGDCATCKVSVDAMEEAGLSYRAWLPIVPLVWLREATVAKAAELTGSDWSDVIAAGRRGDRGASDAGAAAGGGAAAGVSAGGAGDAMAAETVTASEAGAGGRRTRIAAGAGGLAVLVVLLLALVSGADDTEPPVTTTPAAATATPANTTAATAATTESRASATERRPRRRARTGETITIPADTWVKTGPSGARTTATVPARRRSVAPTATDRRRTTTPARTTPAATAPPAATTPPETTPPPATTTPTETTPPPTETTPPTRTTPPPPPPPPPSTCVPGAAPCAPIP